MKGNQSRRDILKSAALGGLTTGIAVSALSIEATAGTVDNGPNPNKVPGLFRFIDSGVDLEETMVRVYEATTNRKVTSFEINTIGGNHPVLQGKSHSERFPRVASDIDSFGGLPPGRFRIGLEHDNSYGEKIFSWVRKGSLTIIKYLRDYFQRGILNFT